MRTIEVKEFVATDFRTTEAMKALRTNFIFSGEAIKAVALTSFQPNEGKSTIAFQLCASLAETGKRTLLVDADLRNSVLVNTLKVRDKVDGLSHYLTGLAKANDLINSTDVPNLFVMFAGVRVPNSAELLGGDNFRKLIAALKDIFDYIIVDTAPLGLVIDTAVVAPALDGVVMVIDSTNNSYKQERRIQAQIEKTGGKVLGVVLNRVDFTDNGTYGAYGKYGDYGSDTAKTE